LVEINLNVDDALYCRCGIECCRTKSATTLRMQNKMAVWDVILETQKVSQNAEVMSGVYIESIYLMGILDAEIADAPNSLCKSQMQDKCFNILAM
jgi:hypothetical protein